MNGEVKSDRLLGFGLFRFRQDFTDRSLEPRMIVRDYEFDAGQASLAKTQKKVAPARPALAVGKLHGEDLPATFPRQFPQTTDSNSVAPRL